VEHAHTPCALELARRGTQQASRQRGASLMDSRDDLQPARLTQGNYVNQRGGLGGARWEDGGLGVMSEVHPVDLDRWRTRCRASARGQEWARSSARGGRRQVPLFRADRCPCDDGAGQSVAARNRHRRRDRTPRRSRGAEAEAHLRRAQRLKSHGSYGFVFAGGGSRLGRRPVPFGFDDTIEDRAGKGLARIHPEDVPLCDRRWERPEWSEPGHRACLGCPADSVKHVHVSPDTMKEDSGMSI